MTKTPQASTYEQAACVAARRAGEILRRRFREQVELRIEIKGHRDFVTEVDREAEAAVVGYLRQEFPDHAMMAEEGSPEVSSAGFRWIVDPLDGTTNFIHGVPTFAVSVALEDPSGLLAAAIYDPIQMEMYHAHRGGGAWLNGTPIRSSRPAHLADALVATGFPFRELSRLGDYLRVFEAFVHSTSGLRRAGSAALDLAYTSCGRYDGFWEIGLAPWDVAAGALLVREAGGIVTNPRGGPDFLAEGDILAAGPTLHAAMLELTKSLPARLQRD